MQAQPENRAAEAGGGRDKNFLAVSHAAWSFACAVSYAVDASVAVANMPR